MYVEWDTWVVVFIPKGKKSPWKMHCAQGFFKPMWHDLKLCFTAWVKARALQRLDIALECKGNIALELLRNLLNHFLPITSGQEPFAAVAASNITDHSIMNFVETVKTRHSCAWRKRKGQQETTLSSRQSCSGRREQIRTASSKLSFSEDCQLPSFPPVRTASSPLARTFCNLILYFFPFPKPSLKGWWIKSCAVWDNFVDALWTVVWYRKLGLCY